MRPPKKRHARRSGGREPCPDAPRRSAPRTPRRFPCRRDSSCSSPDPPTFPLPPRLVVQLPRRFPCRRDSSCSSPDPPTFPLPPRLVVQLPRSVIPAITSGGLGGTVRSVAGRGGWPPKKRHAKRSGGREPCPDAPRRSAPRTPRRFPCRRDSSCSSPDVSPADAPRRAAPPDPPTFPLPPRLVVQLPRSVIPAITSGGLGGTVRSVAGRGGWPPKKRHARRSGGREPCPDALVARPPGPPDVSLAAATRRAAPPTFPLPTRLVVQLPGPPDVSLAAATRRAAPPKRHSCHHVGGFGGHSQVGRGTGVRPPKKRHARRSGGREPCPDAPRRSAPRTPRRFPCRRASSCSSPDVSPAAATCCAAPPTLPEE